VQPTMQCAYGPRASQKSRAVFPPLGHSRLLVDLNPSVLGLLSPQIAILVTVAL
jgi:hypothetical protein